MIKAECFCASSRIILVNTSYVVRLMGTNKIRASAFRTPVGAICVKNLIIEKKSEV